MVGGGICGCLLAYFLAGRGADVLVVDRGPLNGEASGSNAGSLHIQLTAGMGDDPEAVRGLAPYLRLCRPAVALWSELGAGLGLPTGYLRRGGLMVAENEADMATLERKVAFERACGLDTALLGCTEALRRCPGLDNRVIGGAWSGDEGWIDPLVVGRGLIRAARQAGVRFRTHAGVTAITAGRGGFHVQTKRGPVRCRRMVNAAGAWGGKVATLTDVRVPVWAGPQHMNVTEAAPRSLDVLMQHATRHLTLKQTGNGAFLIGGGWPAPEDPRKGAGVFADSIAGNVRVAADLLPAIRGLRIVRTWSGLKPVVGDGLPLLGAAAGLPGYFFCITKGYTVAPLCARMVADMMTGRAPDWDPTPFAAERFR